MRKALAIRLEEINIQEITEKAGYHRASWFRNFKSKRDFKETPEQMADIVSRSFRH